MRSNAGYAIWDASAFASLVDLLAADHAVLTTDPRGINRRSVADPDRDSTPGDARRGPLPAPDPPRRRPGRGPGLQRRRRQRPGVKFLANANITLLPQFEDSAGTPAEAPAEPDPQQVADERFWDQTGP